jgi:hypothetical protein
LAFCNSWIKAQLGLGEKKKSPDQIPDPGIFAKVFFGFFLTGAYLPQAWSRQKAD